MKWWGFAAITVALVTSGCTAPDASPSPTPSTLSDAIGTITVPINSTEFLQAGHGSPQLGDRCTAKDGYSDIATGSQVTITDEHGTVIFTANLHDGALTGEAGQSIFAAHCKFSFSLDGLQLGSSFYGIHVGNTNRGAVQYTELELEQGPNLTLGD